MATSGETLPGHYRLTRPYDRPVPYSPAEYGAPHIHLIPGAECESPAGLTGVPLLTITELRFGQFCTPTVDNRRYACSIRSICQVNKRNKGPRNL